MKLTSVKDQGYMPRVLWVMPGINPFTEVWMGRMINILENHICAIVYKSGNPPSGPHIKKYISLQESPLRLERIFRRQGFKHRMANIISQKKPDLIFINYLSVAKKFESVFDEMGIPVVCHTHGADISINLRKHTDPNTRVVSDDYISFVNRAAKKWVFVANSQYSVEILTHLGVPRERVELKYFGVPAEVDYKEVHAKNHEQLRFLYLGRLVDCKGPELTIRAFNRLCDVGVNAELTIAGDGPMRVSCELERLASPYREQIHILGAVDRHAGERLRKSHQVFTAHSRAGPLSRQEEAFGVAFLEAMAAGMPVVTGQNGGIPEVVEHQESGLLFKSGDVEAHAQCLLSLAKDRESRIKMGKNALDRVQSTFSPTQERDALRRIINKAALLS